MPLKIAMLSAMSSASCAPFEEIANEEKSFSWSPTVVEWVMKKFISNHLFQIPQIAMQKNELHYRQCKQEFWQVTNSWKKMRWPNFFEKKEKKTSTAEKVCNCQQSQNWWNNLPSYFLKNAKVKFKWNDEK